MTPACNEPSSGNLGFVIGVVEFRSSEKVIQWSLPPVFDSGVLRSWSHCCCCGRSVLPFINLQPLRPIQVWTSVNCTAPRQTILVKSAIAVPAASDQLFPGSQQSHLCQAQDTVTSNFFPQRDPPVRGRLLRLAAGGLVTFRLT